MSFSPGSLSPSEVAALLQAERRALPFLLLRDGIGDLRLVALEDLERATVGRVTDNDIVLAWDPEVSRTHAELELVGGAWTVADDGLSRNGTQVNGHRVSGRRRLHDGDVLRMGRTTVIFRAPTMQADSTIAAERRALAELTPAERRVLVALCRPLLQPGGGGAASNQEIADALHLSIPGVKTHMRALFTKLAIDDLPKFHKRAEVARRAVEVGLVTSRDVR